MYELKITKYTIFIIQTLRFMGKTIQVFCNHCHQPFIRRISKYNQDLANGWRQFCSRECQWLGQDKKKEVVCACCGNTFIKTASQIRKTKNHFCSRSCAATYSNYNKNQGTRRAKLEVWLESQLSTLYPNLTVHYNHKEAINAELDIYIPSLSLAIEINGIFHYKPIYGGDKLIQIQSNDERKFKACLEKSIELCFIDTSSLTRFEIDKAQKYLQIITQIIDNKSTALGINKC